MVGGGEGGGGGVEKRVASSVFPGRVTTVLSRLVESSWLGEERKLLRNRVIIAIAFELYFELF